MQLISALAGGVIGAESGTASIYIRGSLTAASAWYTDFEGTGSTTGAASLDSTGAAIVYVNQLVTVVVKNSAGTTLKTFVAGGDSPNVEVKSPSFTGTNYETGITGASQPTTLQAVLDRLITSTGTTDFNVLQGGVAVTLQSLAAGFEGLFYNVKDAAYGAVGDGSTDDSVAINAAIDAAGAAGGGTVFFPPGTYQIESTLTTAVTGDIAVNLLGSGSNLTTISCSATTAAISAGLGSSGNTLKWSGLTIVHDAAGTGSLTTWAGTAYRVHLNDIVMGDPALVDVSTVSVAVFPVGATLTATDSSFNFGAVAAAHGLVAGAAASIRGCVFRSIASGVMTVPMLYVNTQSQVMGCRFYAGSGSTSAGFIEVASVRSVVSGNFFDGTGTQSAVLLTAAASSNIVTGNAINTTVLGHADAGTNTALYNTLGTGRVQQYETESTGGQTVTIDPAITEYCHIEMTASAASVTVALDLTTVPPIGTRVTISIKASGANMTATYAGASLAIGPSTEIVQANEYWVVEYMLIAGTSTSNLAGWARVASNGAPQAAGGAVGFA